MYRDEEVAALYVLESGRHTLAPLAYVLADCRSEFHNYRVYERALPDRVARHQQLELSFQETAHAAL